MLNSNSLPNCLYESTRIDHRVFPLPSSRRINLTAPTDFPFASEFLSRNEQHLTIRRRCRWEGPIRLLHSMDINLEDGAQTPFRGMLAFPKGPKSLRIATTGSQEFPCTFGAEVPSVGRTNQLIDYQMDVWESNPKHTMQGTVQEGGLGAVKAFPISDNIESVQIMWWSKDTGKRAAKSKIEVLQGPNSIRQVFDMHCEGTTQPYHAIIETPGTGWTIRMWSKAPLEYPHEIVVEPHTVADDGMMGPDDRLYWD